MLEKYGDGTLVIGGAVNNTASRLVVNGGRVVVPNDIALGAVPSALVPDAVELNGGTLRFFSSLANGISLNANRGLQIDAAGGTLDLSQSSGVPLITYPITGNGRFYKDGIRTASGNTSQSFAGGLEIVAGRWSVQVNGSQGTGSIILAGGLSTTPDVSTGLPILAAQFGIGSSNITGIDIPNEIQLAPVGAGVNGFEINNGCVMTVSGPVTGTGGFYRGTISNGNNSGGTLILSNSSNSYLGDTTILFGVLQVGANEVIPDSSNILTSGSVVNETGAAAVTSAGTFDVHGFTETVGGIGSAAGPANGGTILLGTGTLLVGAANGSISYSGNITGNGNLVKIGTGTQVLGAAGGFSTPGTMSYTGVTQVQAGTLVLASTSAQSRITGSGTGGGDVRGGRIVFDYAASGDNTVPATVKGLLTASFGSNGFNNATQLRSTTADTRRGLGFSDNGSQFTVGYTYYGDTNLSGTVDTSDFTALSQHFNQATTKWADGDFNYDGVVNALDFNALATNFGATPALTAPPALGTLVPEPSTLFALAACGLFARVRSRRSPRGHSPE